MIRRITWGLLAVVVALWLPVANAGAANLGLTIQEIDVSHFPTVRVYASVADSQGVPITGLNASAFTLQEDGKDVKDVRVSSIIDSQLPVAVSLVFDVSGSMADNGKLAAAKKAAKVFIDTLGPNDRADVISFSDKVTIDQGYTGDHAKLTAAIDGLKANGNTAIFDAIDQAAALQGAVPIQRKLILLLTDGTDNRSKTTIDGAIKAAQRSGAPIDAIGLGADVDRSVLNRLASATSGQAIYVTSPAQLSDIFQSIATQLRRQYVLTYTSNALPNGQTNHISLTTRYQGLAATAPGSFVVQAKPLAFHVTGITDASKVAGTLTMSVTITSGVAQEVQLLVDGTVQSTVAKPPFDFTLNTTTVSAGMHTVVIRAKGATGPATEQKFVIETTAPTPEISPTAPPAGAVSTTTVPTPVPTAVPAPTPAPSTASPLLYGGIVAVLVLVAGIGVGGYLLVGRRKPVAVAPPPVVVPPRPPITDRTEAVGLEAGGATIVSSGLGSDGAKVYPKLRVVQQGDESEVTLAETETTVGRESSNMVVVKDALASRRHAKIVRVNGEYWIEDLKSLNGTLMNGEILTGRRKLAANDQIKIGEAVLTFTTD